MIHQGSRENGVTALLEQVAITDLLRTQLRAMNEQLKEAKSRNAFLVNVVRDERREADQEIGTLQEDISHLNALLAQMRAERDEWKKACQSYARQNM